MRAIPVSTVVVALLFASHVLYADEEKGREDASGGNTGGKREPFKDSARSGHWWWPSAPRSNDNDAEIWGNAGTVYRVWQRPAPPSNEPANPAPPTAQKNAKPPTKYGCSPDGPSDSAYFQYDSAQLTSDGASQADRMAKYMKKYPKDTLTLEGHTCDRGSEAYNMRLSQRRAEAVKDYIVKQGVAPERIAVKGLGKTMPAVPNDSEPNRRLNRRVCFSVTIAN